MVVVTVLSLLFAGLVAAPSASACSPQECGKKITCEVRTGKPNVGSSAFYVSGWANSRCTNGPLSVKVKRQWIHIHLQACKVVDNWPDKCQDWGLDGASDAGRATPAGANRWSRASARTECGHHGSVRYWRVRYTQTIQLMKADGTGGKKVKVNGHGPNSSTKHGGKKCGAAV